MPICMSLFGEMTKMALEGSIPDKTCLLGETGNRIGDFSQIEGAAWSERDLEKEMATHSSVLAWRILWTEKPGGLLSMGSHRVGPD